MSDVTLYDRDPKYIPRVAAVHDMCGYGKCSLTAAIPILSAAGCDVCPVPTALFSAHTRYAVFTFHDTTDILSGYLDAWQKEDVELDGVYSGFLGSPDQVAIIQRLYREYPNALRLVDPVMGDAGEMYPTYTPELCEAMGALADGADVLMPNLTEASILTKRDYPGQDIDEATVNELLGALLELGAKNVVLKGIDHGDGKIVNYVASASTGVAGKIELAHEKLPYMIHGTGDAFASALCGAVMFLLPGCGGERLPYAREMGDMALMRTMGVDTGEGGAEQLHVTVSSGRRARGLQGEAEPPLVLSAERESISGACLAMQGLSDSYVFYGHVDQLLLGEELSRRGILETLQYFSQDQELGMGTQVWIVRGGTAAEAISAEQERGVESRLSTIQTDSEMGMAGMTRTVGETLTSLMEDGSAYLPGLVPGGDGALLEAGYGVVKDGMLAGWLTGEQARGLELAAGQVGADILELETRGGGAAVRVTAVSVSCVPEFSGERLTGLELACRLSLRAEESWGAPEPAAL